MPFEPEHLSRKGALFIASFEGFVAEPYNDPAGNATIGYGHLLHYGRVTAADRERWGTLTRDEGLGLLMADAVKAERCVLDRVNPPFQFQWRFDALVSFVFNLGCGILSPKYSIIGYLNRHGMRQKAADVLLMYDHAGGRQLPGLTRRRRAERSLYLYGRYHSRWTR